MGKTTDLFKKVTHTKGKFHAKMGIIKDRNCMNLTEAEDIKKRWQEYTEELYSPSTLWQIEWEKVETVTDFIFLAPKSLHMVTVAMKLKDAYSWKESYDQPT